MKALFKPVGKAWEMRDVENALEALQKAVGGYIEVVGLWGKLVAICDEEGRIKGKKHNVTIDGVEFVGDILVVGSDGDEFTDVTVETPEEFKFIYDVE